MKKPLAEMTPEELRQLFPIILTAPKKYWGDWYNEEKSRLLGFLPPEDIKINHIGSTAIKGIWAKPTVDILLEIPQSLSLDGIKELLENNGYFCMSEEEKRKSFNRGYTNEGFAEKVFHLHLRFHGDNEELYFRDYLNDNPPLAKEYEALKLSLWKGHEYDRDAYTDAKTPFIAKWTECAKPAYKNRY